ncbi:hypothetical protein DICPUDRAFT_158234 [Dictyostelium purpureum]|uniref:Uncharacterized protein n=1 Tax=Dictyostelium purpureum TaxID=5786 RepID=F1A151_DICPU|nr:uncharacterized protein DICPUDRAFT_158234 [Dictyostelium purpureum]EGC30082.1 hypothetical protein DICPUDRAFT_158234 [Dictyostelium purpureum]|eukprot:XP_003293393.1 hypothetical protein DICPUDRAFT_158234 [Dictyostelium purpureum]
MEDRGDLECGHSKFDVKELYKYDFMYLQELVDQDDFPVFQPGICSVACKEKMKFIVNHTFSTFLKLLNNYFDDSKMVFDRSLDYGLPPWSYYRCLNSNSIQNSDIPYINLMNVGFLVA